MVDKPDSNSAVLVNLLSECTPGNLSPEVFDAVARVAVYPAIELMPYRYLGEAIEIGLLQRPSDDKFWPTMWHIPGTVLRPTDSCLSDAFKRLSSDEFEQPDSIQPEFISVNVVPYTRGTGLTIEHAINLTDIQNTGELTFFDINDLPDNFIPEQKPIINRLGRFLEQKVN